MNEDLRKWFGKGEKGGIGGGGWDEYNTKGERTGKCARGEDDDGEGPKPKCLSKEKAAKMSKKEIAAAVKRKRREDPVADRPGKGGKPKMVSNKIDEGLLDRLRGEKKRKVGTSATYGGMTQDEIRAQNRQRKINTQTQSDVNQGNYDDPWLRGAPSSERKHHYRQLRGEQVENSNEIRYCPMCKKKEKRTECSYGPEMWDAVTVSMPDFSMDEEKSDPCWKGYKQVGTKKKNGKEVPNCVPVNETSFQIKHTSADVKKANRLKKIDALARRGTGGEQKNAARMSGVSLPSIKKEEISIVDKILLEMEAEVLNEKNVPTNPSLWSKMKERAKAKFDVYPSAYANGWAAKEYKKAGGKWKSVSEEIEIQDAYGETFAVIDDVIKADPIKCPRCGQNPCICDQLMGYNEVNEAIRIPSKTGNILLVTLNWRGKYYAMKMFFPQVSMPTRKDVQNQIDKVYPGARVLAYNISDIKPGEQFLQTEDWQKVNRKDKTDGLSQNAVNAYRRENPGSKLQTAVTEKNPKGKRAERRKSFCSRSAGQRDMHNIDCSKTPDKPICKARRRWKC